MTAVRRYNPKTQGTGGSGTRGEGTGGQSTETIAALWLGPLVALTLGLGAGCELVAGIDERPAYEGGGGASSSSTSSSSTSSSGTGGDGGGGASSSGGGEGGTCPDAEAGCEPHAPDTAKWSDATQRCHGGGVKPCTYPGEDGDIAGKPASYSVDSGIVTDQLTGLAWTQHPVGDEKPHEETASGCGAFGEEWRLPNLLELLSVMDHGLDPLVNSVFTVGGQPSHWVAEPGGQGHYFIMLGDKIGSLWDLAGGEMTWGFNLVTAHYHCVQGTELHNALTVVDGCEPQLVRDATTGLEWQLVPSGEQLNWPAALEHCRTLCDHGGGWRLATVKELATLFEPSASPAITSPFAVGTTGEAEFWTSTPLPSSEPLVEGAVYLVDFAPLPTPVFWGTGDDYAIRREAITATHRPWCVRSHPGI